MNPRRRLLTGKEAAILCGVQPATIRDWVRRRELAPVASYDNTRTALYLEVDVLLAERRIRGRREAATLCGVQPATIRDWVIGATNDDN